MTDDLHTALHDLAGDGAAEQRDRLRAGRGLDAGSIARVAGRNRHRRTATTAAVAVIAATGILLAGVTLADRPDAQPAVPPSSTSPAPTPSTSTGTTGVVLPTGDASLPFGACGSLADAAPAAPVTDQVTVQVDVGTTTSAAGDRLPVSAEVTPVDWTTTVAVPTDGPQYAVLADGVVVGTATQHATTTGTWSVVGELGLPTTHSDEIELTVCAPDGSSDATAGLPLPAGTYQLVAWAQVALLADTTSIAETWDDPEQVARLVSTAGETVTVVGTATTLTVTGTADQVQARTGDAAALQPVDEPVAVPACGEAAPTPSPAGDLTLTVLDTQAPTVALRYSGPGRVQGQAFEYVWLWAVQDGVVVGGTWYETDGSVAFDLADGPGQEYSLAGEITACPAYGTDPLPAGDYQVYPALSLTTEQRVLPDGTVVASGASVLVVGEPYLLTVP